MKPWKLIAVLLMASALASYARWIHPSRPAHEPLALELSNSIPLLRLEGPGGAHELWQRDATIFVDTRTEAEFVLGHIAGAILLPEEELEQRFPALKDRLARADSIVVYCKNLDCGKSLWTAIRLRQLGLVQTTIYPAGWYEWLRHELPQGTGVR